ncbi:MAG: hypothetical protein WAK08_21505, partial [Pseudolabrys sp.]
VDEVIEEHAAEALHHGAERLSVHQRGIDGTADILYRHIVQHCDMTGARVNGDVRGMSAVGVGAIGIGEGSFGRDRAGGGRELSEVQ